MDIRIRMTAMAETRGLLDRILIVALRGSIS